jgi:hypothetical protein
MSRVSAFLAGVGGAVRGVLDALWRALSSDPEDRPWERAAVRIVVPFAFVSAGLVAAFVAYRGDRPPAVAFENRLVFAGELLVVAFYGVLLVLVPLVRAIAGGELPIELNARGARYAEGAVEEWLSSNRELLERVQDLEEELTEQEDRGESHGRQAARRVIEFESELAGLRARLEACERRVG